MNLTADIRGLLHYVPEFRGKIFVIDIDWADETDAVKAEVLMDLTALQSVGVRLILSLTSAQADDFFDYSAELEFKVSSKPRQADSDDIIDVLDRGQAVIIERAKAVGLVSDDLVDLSVRLQAKKLVVVARDVPVTVDGEVIKFIHVTQQNEYPTLKKTIADNAIAACFKGVSRVHLLEIRQQGVIINEMFSTEGVGTMFYTDSYRKVRPLQEEDISEMLSMIGWSVRNTHLVPRTYEEVKENISDYYVMEVDDNVVGCGALYEYETCAEVACLYVKQSHGGTGYGAEIVTFLEKMAVSKKVSKVFALSNRAATFFLNVVGYTEVALDDLPHARRERLLESGRESRAFIKDLT